MGDTSSRVPDASAEEISTFSMPCPLLKMERSVPPATCRACRDKRTCPQVQALLGAEREYAARFKGTILESAMKRVSRAKKDVASYILETERPHGR